MQGDATVKLNSNLRPRGSLASWQPLGSLCQWGLAAGGKGHFKIWGAFLTAPPYAWRMCWFCCISAYFPWLSGRADQVSRFWKKGAVEMEKQIAANRKHLVCKSYHFRTRTDLGDPWMLELGRPAKASVQLREAGTPVQGHLRREPGLLTQREHSLCVSLCFI